MIVESAEKVTDFSLGKIIIILVIFPEAGRDLLKDGMMKWSISTTHLFLRFSKSKLC